MDLTNRGELIKYLKGNGLYAKKSMGQNFLVNEGVLDKIIAVADLKKDDTVLEIGPGLGIMTDKLVEKAGEVIAVEKDDKLAELLICKYQETRNKTQTSTKKQETKHKQEDKVKIINADILDINFEEILRLPLVVQDDNYNKNYRTSKENNNLQDSSTSIGMTKKVGVNNIGNYKLVANIPYCITGQVFRKFLGTKNKPDLIVMLVQREVAERICAKPGKMSVLSVMVQYYGQPEIVKVVKAGSFFPAPKIDSAILKVDVYNHKFLPLIDTDNKAFMRCVKHGFSSRRKTLVNNLSAGYQVPKEKIVGILERNNFNKNTRAQELSVKDWQKISNKIKEIAD